MTGATAWLLLLLGGVLAACGGAPDAWSSPPPPGRAPARPVRVEPVPVPDAVAALAALRERLYGRPFYAVASLTVRRSAGDRELLVRLHYRARDRVLVRLAGPPREDGMTALRTDEGVHLWFPRAGLRLRLPPTLDAERLAGSDFAFSDLLSLGADADRWVPVAMVRDDAADGPRRMITLRPTPRASTLLGELRLWLALEDGLPVRLEALSPRGGVVRSVEMQRGPRSGYPLPTHWIARTHGTRGGVSELDFRFFEHDPPLDESLFTVAGLERWR